MDKKYGVLLVFLTAIISGVSIFTNKYGVSKVEPYTFTFLKNVVVATFLLSLVLFTKELKTTNLKKKQIYQLILIGLIGGSIPFLLFFKGLSMTSASVGGFIHKTLFIFASFFALIFLKEKIPKKMLIIALILIIGNFLLLNLKSFSFGIGEFLILIATVMWGLENVISKNILKQLSGNLVALGRMFFGSLFILLFLIFTNKINVISSLTYNDVIWILLTSVLLLFFVITYYNGLKYIKVSVATSILLLGSPITTLLSYLFSNYNISINELFGMVLILVGIIASVLFGEYSRDKVKVFQQHTHNG